MAIKLPKSLLWISESIVEALLKFYDYPHPKKTGEIIEGYDKGHALRTAKMCAAVARHLGHGEKVVCDYQIACLLHDLGRAGLDEKLFGKIWSWANAHEIPTRPLEWREKYPETEYGNETEAFWDMYCSQLQEIGVENTDWAKEQIEMRLGYARRFNKQIKNIKPKLKKHGIEWSDWMEKVILYYYYPEKMDNAPDWTRKFGEILVACEQLEAYSNRTRGKDYYNRGNESFIQAFDYLESLKKKRLISGSVLSALRNLIADGLFDDILKDARNGNISKEELNYLRSINTEDYVCLS